MGESSPVKGQVFLHKNDMDAPLRQTQHYSPQVIEVAGQPVHRVTKHSVAFADEALHGLQLSSSLGRYTSLPEALSVNVLSRASPSSWRASF
jgi:hypothetical protein